MKNSHNHREYYNAASDGRIVRARVHIQRPQTLMVVREWVGCGAGQVGRFDVFPQGTGPGG